jgi:hypothetical protein
MRIVYSRGPACEESGWGMLQARVTQPTTLYQNLGEGMHLVNVKLDGHLLDTGHFLPSANSAGLGGSE